MSTPGANRGCRGKSNRRDSGVGGRDPRAAGSDSGSHRAGSHSLICNNSSNRSSRRRGRARNDTGWRLSSYWGTSSWDISSRDTSSRSAGSSRNQRAAAGYRGDR